MDCNLKTHCRWMIRRDVEEVMAIEEECFDYPWTKEQLAKKLRERHIIGMVAEHRERIVGFMVYGLYRFHLHLINFAVLPEVWRNGVGTQMVDKLIGKLSQQKSRLKIICEIKEGNTRAHLFFRSCGFRAVDILHDYYDDVDEDAYVFEYLLAPAQPRPVKVLVAD